MNVKNAKTLHDLDWEVSKPDYASLQNDKDISARMELLTKFLKKHRAKTILDIGCGSGYFGHLVKQIDSEVEITGFDISKSALKKVESYNKKYFLDIDEEDIPEQNDYFDMVVCTDVLEHIYDATHCLSEIKRVMKPKGKAIITTPNFSYWKYRIKCLFGKMPKILRDSRHIRVFNHAFLTKICYNKGFEISYTEKEKKAKLAKIWESVFNKTIVLVLTKRDYE